MNQPLLSLDDFGVQFEARSGGFFRKQKFFAVRHVSMEVFRNETFCLIGESGSGKTTLIRALLGFHGFHEGRIVHEGEQVAKSRDKAHRRLIQKSQLVFQDPVSSLSPFMTLADSMEEPLRARGIGKRERKERIALLAGRIGLSEELLFRKPAQASGGQNQRACIGRALSTSPEILFLDEPLASLDPVVQRRVSDLLCRIKAEQDITFFMITHDLGLVKTIGSRVAVMYLGGIVETAPGEAFFSKPMHPYSRALLSSSLTPGLWTGKRIVLEGEMPSALSPPKGCPFHPRCRMRLPVCEQERPPRRTVAEGHHVACHLN